MKIAPAPVFTLYGYIAAAEVENAFDDGQTQTIALGGAGRIALIDEWQLDIFLRRHSGQQVKTLKDKADLLIADLGQLFFRVHFNGLPLQRIDAAVGHIEAADDIHQRGFTAAGGTDDGDKLALCNKIGWLDLRQAIIFLASWGF